MKSYCSVLVSSQLHCVGVDHVHARIGKRMLIQSRHHRMRGEQTRHLRIQIHQRDALDRWILQDFADRQSVAAAQHQHAMRAGKRGKSRMHQRFVIAVFVARAELQMRIQEQPQIVFPLGKHDALIGRIAAEDHLVGVEAIVGGGWRSDRRRPFPRRAAPGRQRHPLRRAMSVRPICSRNK